MIIYNQQHPSKSKQPPSTINKKRKEHPSQPKSESPSKKLKPYDELHKTQRSVRRKTAMNLLQRLSIPISALQPTIPPQQVVHLPTSIRQQMRSVKGIRMPSEKVMIALKHELSVTHGTATATAIQGDLILTYLTDPLSFIRIVACDSDYITIGGDSGGDSTKLGVTYTNKKEVEEFSPIVITNQKDNYASLNKLNDASLFQFTGETKKADVKNIWQVFQYFVTYPPSRFVKIFLNGDLLFVNAVLGLLSPSSSNPCPICLVDKHHLLTPAHPRLILSTMLEHSAFRPALLIIYYTQILPTPLHVFLGIGNRIIDQILPKLVDPMKLAAAKQSVKSVYSYGSGGVTNVHELNGPELAKFVKQEWDFIQDEKAVRLLQWMRALHSYLLHKRQWTDDEITQFQFVVNEIQSQWETVTGQNAFPKLHMLTHCVEFASYHRYLGKYSEARVESCHSIINHAVKHTHRNRGKQLGEKLRASLADMSLRTIKLALSPKK